MQVYTSVFLLAITLIYESLFNVSFDTFCLIKLIIYLFEHFLRNFLSQFQLISDSYNKMGAQITSQLSNNFYILTQLGSISISTYH